MGNKKKIAVLLADEFEDSELTRPVDALEGAGHEVTIVGTEASQRLEGKQGDAVVTTDASIADCEPESFDALLIPGGHSPDHLRTDERMVAFTKAMVAADKPVAAVCHGPQLLIEAGVVSGKRMTSFESVRTDLRNAGADVVDEEVVIDMPFITSRKPDDLDAFGEAMLARL